MNGLHPAIPILAAYFHTHAVIEFAFAVFVLAMLAMFPPIWKTIWAPAAAVESTSPVRPMRRMGIFAAYLVIAIIVGGSLFDMLRDTEHWPWSNFPMYSAPEEQTASFQDYRLYGVLQNDHSEISLATDSRYTQPFDPSRLAEALAGLAGDPRINEGLLDCLVRYENLRKAGAHDGPPLSGIRMYKVRFTLDPWGRNTEQPDQKLLISEVSLPTGKAL